MPTEFAPMQVNYTHIPWQTHRSPYQPQSRQWALNSKSVVHVITYIFCDMPTEFAPMQVNDTHIPWHTHTDPRLNDRVNLVSNGSVK
jgi:hypothetical protein